MVAECSKAAHPTLQNLVLRQVELASHEFLHLLVGKVVVELGKCAEECQFERLPCGRKFGLVVVAEVLFDEVLLGTGHLAVERA